MWSVRLFLGCWLIAIAAQARSENWPRWRGPSADGHSTESTVPVTWDAGSVVWKTPLKGSGQSSPIVWGDRIFLTSASEGGRDRFVLAIDRKTGKQLWEQKVAWSGEPERLHKMNSWASPSCVTDGVRVVAFFGRAGLHCYTVEGKHLWSQDLGPFEANPWGTAACPVIVGELVVQNCDNDVGARLVAVDKQSGKIVWDTPRPEHRGWSTPILQQVEGQEQLLLNGHTGIIAYNPKTGQQLWSCKSFNGRGEPTVTPGKELVYLVNGLAGDIYAVRPGGQGDVTSTRMAWHTPRRTGRDLPSPILVGNYLVVASMGGIGTCYDAATGKVLWQDRLEGNYSASPIAAGNNVYFQAENGQVVVIEPGPSYKVVARNSVNPSADEIFRASPAIADGQIFLRSDTVLYCVGSGKATSGR